MNVERYYPVCIISSRQKYFLFWATGNNQPDMFVPDPYGSRLLISYNLDSLLEQALKLGLRIESDMPPSVFDLDKMWRIIANLYPSHRISYASCKAVLDAWNIVEDIARSLHLKRLGIPKYQLKIVQSSYEKIFFGSDVLNNLPIKLKNKTALSYSELKYTKRFLRVMWREIVRNEAGFKSWRIPIPCAITDAVHAVDIPAGIAAERYGGGD